MTSHKFNYTFVLDKTNNIEIYLPESVFEPTYTSNLCIEAAQKIIDINSSVLDLGCGSGIVGLALAKNNDIKKISCSDLSPHATSAAKINFELYGIDADIRTGSLFEPWKKSKFDFIIDDVSGISEEVAKMSPWFGENIPCFSGKDGTELTLEVIYKAKNFLNTSGGLFIPVISLSNVNKLIKIANKSFKNVSEVASKTWALPKDMMNQIERLKQLKSEGIINFEERFGTILCNTKIYYLRD